MGVHGGEISGSMLTRAEVVRLQPVGEEGAVQRQGGLHGSFTQALHNLRPSASLVGHNNAA